MKYTSVIFFTIILTLGLAAANKKIRLINKMILFVPIAIIFALVCYAEVFIKNMSAVFLITLTAMQLILAVLSMWDIKQKAVYSIGIYILFLVCAVMMLINPYCKILNNVITGFILTCVLIVVYKIGKTNIGKGDVEVISAMAFALGYPHIFSIMFAALLTAMLCGVALMIFKKAALKTELPFIPFIFLAVLLNTINF